MQSKNLQNTSATFAHRSGSGWGGLAQAVERSGLQPLNAMEGKQRHLFEHPLERSSGAVPEWNLGAVPALSRDKKGLPASDRVQITPTKRRTD